MARGATALQGESGQDFGAPVKFRGNPWRSPIRWIRSVSHGGCFRKERGTEAMLARVDLDSQLVTLKSQWRPEDEPPRKVILVFLFLSFSLSFSISVCVLGDRT